jgi:hypothetical protein
VLRLMRRELARIGKRKGYRTPITTLAELAEHNVYWSPGRLRRDVIGEFPLANVGLAISTFLTKRFGIDRERGERVCADEAAALCGVRGWQRWPPAQRLWWRRWAPLVSILPGVARWSAADRRALVAVVRAKGGRRESDYVHLLNGHAKLRAALRRLAAR